MEDLFLQFLHKTLFSVENDQAKIQAFDSIKSAYELRNQYLASPSSALLAQLEKFTDFESTHEHGPLSHEVEHSDIIKIILQYLQDTQLSKSFKTLEEESHIYWSGIDSIEDLQSEIKEGSWDHVLEKLSNYKLEQEMLFYLYETIFLELIQKQEWDNALGILNSQVLRKLKDKDPERFMRLEKLAGSRHEVNDIYAGSFGMAERKIFLAGKIEEYLEEVPKQRLLTIISQALKYMKIQKQLPAANEYDLLKGKARESKKSEEFVKYFDRYLETEEDSKINCFSYTPDGNCLITGSNDGFIEVWDPYTGKLKTSLLYQQVEEFMVHEESILSLACLNDYIAAGDSSGDINIWKIATGQCSIKFPSIHKSGVISLAWSEDSSKVVAGSPQGVIKILGLKAQTLLGEYHMHSSYVNCLQIKGNKLFSAGGDGTVVIYDLKRFTWISTLNIIQTGNHQIIYIKVMNFNEIFVVCAQGNAGIYSYEGEAIKSFETGLEVLSGDVSSLGKFVYIANQGKVNIFNLQGEFLHNLDVKGLAIAKISIQPNRDSLSILDDYGKIQLWTA
ncbi:unnamed protein product [Blepharisma stoltei]|uniref:CTLH domain-containing protein n=1 Tax=Blepharisma stoltei TaxID=1481888 RepID=A0AAU9K1N1_9CILI|nr:unnamed protein product [Blepharisma stoltei]